MYFININTWWIKNIKRKGAYRYTKWRINFELMFERSRVVHDLADKIGMGGGQYVHLATPRTVLPSTIAQEN